MDVCQWCHDWTRNHSSPKVYFSDWLTWEGGMTKGSDTLSGYPGPCNRCYILYVAPLRGYVKSSPVASYVYIAARKRGRLTQSLHWGATWRTDVNWWTYAVATLDLGEYNRREPIRSTGVTTFLIFSCTWTNPDHYLIHSSIFFFQFFFCEMQREPKALTVISWSCLHSQTELTMSI